MRVIKSSDVTQEFDGNKILSVLEFATKNTSIDPHKFYDQVLPQIKDGMQTTEIQKLLIKYAVDSISSESTDMQFVASNLEQFALRKEVYGRFEPCSFYRHIKKLVEMGRYDPEILEKYSEDEINYLEHVIDHNRDFTFSYAGTMQLKEKYLVKSRDDKEKKILETPQFAYMLISMCLHQEEKYERLDKVAKHYNASSLFMLSLPTPIMAGVRTPTRQFSSCVVIESGDSLESINETSSAIVKYISKRAGIGINGGALRAIGSKIGNGEVIHTGVIPFWKLFHAAVKSCSQGGVRGGAATVYYPMWHLEFENLIVLKNNKGVDENRIRHLDYGIQINDLMIERLVNDDYITLFSPDVLNGELYDAYFADSNKFKELYEELENTPFIRKKSVKAREIFSVMMMERASTARNYIYFVDNVGDHTPFDRLQATVKQSNLCLEITIPTKPMDKNGEGEIGLCTLTAMVLDKFNIHDQDEVNELCEIAVRALDNLLDYQDYPVEQAAIHAPKRRSLGIGLTNFAGWLASNFLKYNDSEARILVHEMMERIQYGLIKASVKLAKERGACEYFNETRWAKGELPVDWYNKNVDKLVKPVYHCDWESLRKELLQFGIRNSTLSALMPCETSSQISNSTNGIEPPRQLITVKQSKSGSFKQVVPNYDDLKDVYDLAWNMSKEHGNEGYLSLVAILQKFTCQSISANGYYIPSAYPSGKLPMSVMLRDLLYAWKHGVKTFYYHNTDDGSGDDIVSEACDTCAV